MHALLLLPMTNPTMQDCWVPVSHAISAIALCIFGDGAEFLSSASGGNQACFLLLADRDGAKP